MEPGIAAQHNAARSTHHTGSDTFDTRGTSTITTEPFELSSCVRPTHTTSNERSNSPISRRCSRSPSPQDADTNDNNVSSSLGTLPMDGGYGWVIVSACAWFLACTNGLFHTWGVLQAAMLRTGYQNVSPSVISLVGSLSLTLSVAFGLVAVRLTAVFGAAKICAVAFVMLSLGVALASLTLRNISGLFTTAGAVTGLAICVLYTNSNSQPVQWWNKKLGLANGLVKFGGGLGAVVMPVASQALVNSVGLAWTFRTLGFFILATGVPTALLLKERDTTVRPVEVQWSIFRNMYFVYLCLAGGISTFALFVPTYFLPLFATSIGFSPTMGAGLVSGFGTAATMGRLCGGFACDKIGSLNTLLITMTLNAVSMMAIWTISTSLAPLVAFAVVNGLANGAFFSVFPTAVASVTTADQAAAMMSIATGFWSVGYLCGTPIAGALISMSHASSSSPVKAYYAAIFYAGGIAIGGDVFVLAARLTMDRRMVKKL